MSRTSLPLAEARASTPDGPPDPAASPPARPERRWRAALSALRSHQWSKNVLLFVPLAMNHELHDPAKLAAVFTCFVAMSLLASAVYVLNDLLDREADRAHPIKCRRPFASGLLGVRTGIALVVAATTASAALTLWRLPGDAALMLAAYAVLTTAYSTFLKRKVMLDVLTLAALYTHRILTGGVVAGVIVSEWLLAFAIFLFLSLALAKRYTELSALPLGAEGRIQGRGYWPRDLDLVRSLGPTSGTVAVLVLVLYIQLSPEVARFYPNHRLLYLVCPVVLYWITRVWFLAQRQQLHHDPVVFALRDRISLLAGAVILALFVLASWSIPS